jgi:hypothetical protein
MESVRTSDPGVRPNSDKNSVSYGQCTLITLNPFPFTELTRVPWQDALQKQMYKSTPKLSCQARFHRVQKNSFVHSLPHPYCFVMQDSSNRLRRPLHSTVTPNPLNDVQALTFNVFGTVGDYYHTISRELAHREPDLLTLSQAEEFVLEWRRGYFREIVKVAEGSGGTFIIDEMHRNVNR